MKIDIHIKAENSSKEFKELDFGITLPDELCKNPARIRDVFTDLNIEDAVEGAIGELCNAEPAEQE